MLYSCSFHSNVCHVFLSKIIYHSYWCHPFGYLNSCRMGWKISKSTFSWCQNDLGGLCLLVKFNLCKREPATIPAVKDVLLLQIHTKIIKYKSVDKHSESWSVAERGVTFHLQWSHTSYYIKGWNGLNLLLISLHFVPALHTWHFFFSSFLI